jgi:hypothetical protein
VLKTTTEPEEINVKILPEYVRGKDLAKLLKINTATLFRYQRMAKFLISDYKKTHVERIPMDRYQCWVLNLINVGFKMFKNKAFIERKIAENENEFSREAYTKATGLP